MSTENQTIDQGEVLDLQDLFKEESQEENIPLNLEEDITDPPKSEEPEKEERSTEIPKELSTSNYKALVQRKIDSGEWYAIEGFEEVDVTEEVFEEIIQAQMAKKEEDAKVDTVKTDSLSPIMLKALEIDKNGGNVSQVFETYKNIYENPSNPISNLDLENPADQENLVRFYHKNKGLEDFEINSIIDGHKKNLTLDKAAGRAKQDIDTVFNSYLESQAVQAQEAKIQKQEALKNYRTSLSDEAKKYDLNDNFRKTIVDKLSKPDEKGVYAVDALYDEWRKNPEKAVKLAMFLTNEEEYVKNKAAKIINAEKQQTFNSIKLTNKGKGSGTVDYNTSKNDKESGVLNLSEL